MTLALWLNESPEHRACHSRTAAESAAVLVAQIRRLNRDRRRYADAEIADRLYWQRAVEQSGSSSAS